MKRRSHPLQKTRKRGGYATKGPAASYSNLYHNWRAALAAGRGVFQAAAAHTERFMGYRARQR